MFHCRNINVFDDAVRPKTPLKLVYNMWGASYNLPKIQKVPHSKTHPAFCTRDCGLNVKSRVGNGDCNFKQMVREPK